MNSLPYISPTPYYAQSCICINVTHTHTIWPHTTSIVHTSLCMPQRHSIYNDLHIVLHAQAYHAMNSWKVSAIYAWLRCCCTVWRDGWYDVARKYWWQNIACLFNVQQIQHSTMLCDNMSWSLSKIAARRACEIVHAAADASVIKATCELCMHNVIDRDSFSLRSVCMHLFAHTWFCRTCLTMLCTCLSHSHKNLDWCM